MKIILCELEDLCNAMLARLEDAGLSTVYFSENFYWTVLYDDALDQRDSNLGAGSLQDDLEWLNKVLSGELPMGFFESLGGIITAIGHEWEKLPQQTTPNNMSIKLTDLRRLLNYIFISAKKEGQGFVELDVPFDKYWRINTDCIYAEIPPAESQIKLQPLPDNLATLTQHICNSKQLTIKDFGQIGILFNVLGLMPESILYTIVEIKKK